MLGKFQMQQKCTHMSPGKIARPPRKFWAVSGLDNVLNYENEPIQFCLAKFPKNERPFPPVFMSSKYLIMAIRF